jgi:molybdopterin adenylyltransferase
MEPISTGVWCNTMRLVEVLPVHIAVLTIADDAATADRATAQAISDKAGTAGHVIVDEEIARDNESAIRDQLVRWISEDNIDVVIVAAAVESEAASAALAPLIHQTLPGFTDLFRWLTFQEIGASAMLSAAEAAQCQSTFIFVLPAHEAAVRAAMDKLILPQLDVHTKPKNLVSQMPRLKQAAKKLIDAAKSQPVAAPVNFPSPPLPSIKSQPAPLATATPPQAVPFEIEAEKTAGGSGLPPKLPARNKPATANLIARKLDDPPTKPIDIAKLEKQIQLSTQQDAQTKQIDLKRQQNDAKTKVVDMSAHQAKTRVVDSGRVLPRLPPGADESALDEDGEALTFTAPRNNSEPQGLHGSVRSGAPIGVVKGSSSSSGPNRAPRELSTPSFSTPVSRKTPRPQPVAHAPRESTNPSLQPAPPSSRESTQVTNPSYPREPVTNPSYPREPVTNPSYSRAATPVTNPSYPRAGTPVTNPAMSRPASPAAPATPAPTSRYEAKPAPSTIASRYQAKTAAATPPATAIYPPSDEAKTTPAAKPSDEPRAPSGTTPPPPSPFAKPPTTPPPFKRGPTTPPPISPSANDGEEPTTTYTAEAAWPKPPPANAVTTSEDEDDDEVWRARAAAAAAEAERAAQQPPRQAQPNAAELWARSVAPAQPEPEPELLDASAAEIIEETTDDAPSPVSTLFANQPVRKREPTAPPPHIATAGRPLPQADFQLPEGDFAYPLKRSGAGLVLKLLIAAAVIGAGFLAFTQLYPSDEPKPAPAVSPAPEPSPPPPAPVVAAATVDAQQAAPEPDAAIETPAATPPPSNPEPENPPPPTTKPPTTSKPPTTKPPTTKPPTTKPPTTTKPTTKPDATDATAEPATPTSSECDEVSCIMTKYERACCLRYKPSDGFTPKNVIPDSLDKAMVKAGIETVKPRIVACGEQNGAKGTVRVAVSVDDAGKVTNVSVTESPDTSLGECVAAAMRKARFGKSVNGAEFNYPFVF